MTISIHTQSLHPRLTYTIDFINQHTNTPKGWTLQLNNKVSDISINYSDKQSNNLTIPKLNVCFKNSFASLVLQKFKHNNQPIYGLTKEKIDCVEFFYEGKFAFDIFESIFFHIARFEEVMADESDHSAAGWLEESKHLLVKQGIEKVPVVDHLVQVFFESLGAQIIKKTSTYSLSHDIDVLYRFKPHYKIPRSILAMIYHKKGFSHFFKSLTLILTTLIGKSKDPFDTYNWLFSEELFFTQKRLFLMAGGNTRHDNLYNIKDLKVNEIVDLAISRNYVIGLHPSFNAGFEKGLFSKEKEKLECVLGRKIRLSRQHWLRWSWNITPDKLTKEKINEDSSIGYAKRIGFRAGTGFDYHLYNFKKEEAFKWKEIPFAYMESALIHESKRSGKSIEEISQDFLEKNSSNTHIEMNWHNSNFDPSLQYGPILKKLFLSINKQRS